MNSLISNGAMKSFRSWRVRKDVCFGIVLSALKKELLSVGVASERKLTRRASIKSARSPLPRRCESGGVTWNMWKISMSIWYATACIPMDLLKILGFITLTIVLPNLLKWAFIFSFFLFSYIESKVRQIYQRNVEVSSLINHCWCWVSQCQFNSTCIFSLSLLLNIEIV